MENSFLGVGELCVPAYPLSPNDVFSQHERSVCHWSSSPPELAEAPLEEEEAGAGAEASNRSREPSVHSARLFMRLVARTPFVLASLEIA